MSAIRPVLSLVVAVWFLQLAGGILGVLTPLGLDSLSVSEAGIGVIAGLYAGGFMAGAYFAPRMISSLGNIRTFAVAASLSAIGALLQGLFPVDWTWAFIRLVQGGSFALMFASAEAWLGVAAPTEHRGSVLGVYNVAAKAALLVGPLIVMGSRALAPENYICAGLFLAAALLPVCLTRQKEPEKIAIERLAVLSIFKASPSAITGVLIAGIVNSGVLALLPIYAATFQLADQPVASAALAFAIVNAGGLLSQWPAGKLSDRFDRRNTIAAMAGVSCFSAVILAVASGSAGRAIIIVSLFLWGAGSLSFYGICVAHGIDRVAERQVTSLMSTLLLVWAFGSVIGPIAAGWLMQTSLGAAGLFVLAAAGLATLSIAMLFRRVSRAPVAEEDQTDWQPIMPAGLPESDLDPRSPGEDDRCT